MSTAAEAWAAYWRETPGALLDHRAAFMAGWDLATHEAHKDTGRTIPARSTDPGTSKAASKTISAKAGTQRGHLLYSFWILGEATDEEAMAHNDNVAPGSEYSKRCSELREAGYIEPTGQTRKGASGMDRIVSRITDLGNRTIYVRPNA